MLAALKRKKIATKYQPFQSFQSFQKISFELYISILTNLAFNFNLNKFSFIVFQILTRFFNVPAGINWNIRLEKMFSKVLYMFLSFKRNALYTFTPNSIYSSIAIDCVLNKKENFKAKAKAGMTTHTSLHKWNRTFSSLLQQKLNNWIFFVYCSQRKLQKCAYSFCIFLLTLFGFVVFLFFFQCNS